MLVICQMSLKTTTCQYHGYIHPIELSAFYKIRPKNEVFSQVVQTIRFEQELEKPHNT